MALTATVSTDVTVSDLPNKSLELRLMSKSTKAKKEHVTEPSDPVVIQISRAKALALFEWAYRFMETHDQRFTHPADAIVVDTLATELEWALPEVFTVAYPRLLAASRAAVEAEYRGAVGLEYTAWLASLDYQDASIVKPESS